MAITVASTGTAGAGTTLITPSVGVGPDVSDLVFYWVVNKYPANPPTLPTTFGPWTQLAQLSAGSGASGADSGDALGTLFVASCTSSLNTGTVSVSVTGGNSTIGRITSMRSSLVRPVSVGGPGTHVWDVALTTGTDTTPGATWASTGGALDVVAGDTVLVFTGANTDSTTYSAQALTIPGIVFGTPSLPTGAATGNGDDCLLRHDVWPTSSGASTGVPSYSAAAAASGANWPCGVNVFVRLREVPKVVTSSAASSAGAATVSGDGLPLVVLASSAAAAGTSTAVGIPSSYGIAAGTSTAVAEGAFLGTLLAPDLDHAQQAVARLAQQFRFEQQGSGLILGRAPSLVVPPRPVFELFTAENISDHASAAVARLAQQFRFERN